MNSYKIQPYKSLKNNALYGQSAFLIDLAAAEISNCSTSSHVAMMTGSNFGKFNYSLANCGI